MKTIENTPPTLQGHARAWKVDLAEWVKNRKPGPDQATVGMWVVNAPWSHPIWPNVLVFVIHLRDVPGQSKPPHKYFPEATHEIVVMALSPDHVPELEGKQPIHFLEPANYIGQITAPSDEAAEALLEATVQEIVAGQLNPDTDARRQWKARFGDHAFKKYPAGSIEQIVSDGGTVITTGGVIAGEGGVAVAIIPATADDKPAGTQEH